MEKIRMMEKLVEEASISNTQYIGQNYYINMSTGEIYKDIGKSLVKIKERKAPRKYPIHKYLIKGGVKK